MPGTMFPMVGTTPTGEGWLPSWGATKPQIIPNYDPTSMLKTGTAGSSFSGAMSPDTGLGLNIGTAQLALGGLGALGNIWSSLQANRLANEQFDFMKQFSMANLANQRQSYNTRLEDRANVRAAIEGRPEGWAMDYINRNRLSR